MEALKNGAVDPAVERGVLAGKKLALDVAPGEEVVITGNDFLFDCFFGFGRKTPKNVSAVKIIHNKAVVTIKNTLIMDAATTKIPLQRKIL